MRGQDLVRDLNSNSAAQQNFVHAVVQTVVGRRQGLLFLEAFIYNFIAFVGVALFFFHVNPSVAMLRNLNFPHCLY